MDGSPLVVSPRSLALASCSTRPTVLSLESDESEDFFRKFVRPLLVGKVTGAVDRLEARAGNGGAIGATIILTENAIMRSQQKQGRNTDAVQPSLKLWIVHVGRPGVAGDCLAVASSAANLILRHRPVVTLADIGIAVSNVEEIGFGHGEDVGDVAMLAVAYLDAHRVGQDEMGDPGGGFDGDLGCDPAAERDTGDDNAPEIELIEEIEVEIGKVVDAVERFRRLRSAETRMGRNNQAHARGEPGEDGSARLDADAGMEKQQG